VDIAALYNKDKVTISFELFPPKTWKGMANLFAHFEELASCGPDFVTCTYGAGGSAHQRTFEVLDWVREDHSQIPVVAHLTCVGATRDELRATLEEAKKRNVSAIVALRGDPPKGESNFQTVAGGLAYANELVSLIREEFPQMGIFVAGYPETHPEAVSADVDIENLKRKVDAGAGAVITQLFYNNDMFFRFRDRCEKAGIHVPIIPGILPVTSLKQIKRITSLCGATLSDLLITRLENQGDDAEGQFSVGVYFAARQVEALIESGVPGVHFYVMNKSRATALICRALALSHKQG
jgi:methylenetetrahydrofolate reductase (NADPH)